MTGIYYTCFQAQGDIDPVAFARKLAEIQYDQAFNSAYFSTIMVMARVDVNLGDPKTEPPSDT